MIFFPYIITSLLDVNTPNTISELNIINVLTIIETITESEGEEE